MMRSPQITRARAKEHRRDYTVAEGLLWNLLRNRKLRHLKFRRQRPVGPFIVDFFCATARLVLEVDGPTHEKRREYDAARTRFLNGRGYRVLRFKVDEVTRNGDWVMEEITKAATLTPTLSRVREPVRDNGAVARERESEVGGHQ